MIRAPGVGEEEKFEEKFGETMDEEVEEAGVEDLHMEDRPSFAPAEASEVPRASTLEGWRFKTPPNHKPNQHYSACKLQHPNPPIIKSAANVRDSNLISTPSFANRLYCPVFSHQAIR